jgi:flagellar biogenesis protein FliO
VGTPKENGLITTMGSLLLAIALIVEIAFAIFCLVTKQNNKKFKNWMRVAILKHLSL